MSEPLKPGDVVRLLRNTHGTRDARKLIPVPKGTLLRVTTSAGGDGGVTTFALRGSKVTKLRVYLFDSDGPEFDPPKWGRVSAVEQLGDLTAE